MPLPIDSSWKLTFDDEFNGSTLNLSKWSPNWHGSATQITTPANPVELAAYDPNQAKVANGFLNLQAIASPVTVGGTNFAYRTGAVETSDHFSQTYGYFEAKITLPASGGRLRTGRHSVQTATTGQPPARWTLWKG